MHKILLPRYATYKEGPQIRGNGAPRKIHLRIQVRVHMSASTRKIHSGEGHLGSADPRVRPNLH